MLGKNRTISSPRPAPARRWARCSAATGSRRCWPRSCPRTNARRCACKLLSERLLAFRDTQGRYALIDEFCAHRGVSLWFGRNEENGLRCPYHGWKYDVTGQCIEVPSEPAESGFCKKIKLKSYPLVERGGVLWTYMGPPEQQPPLPEWEFAMVPAEQQLHLQAAAGMQLAAGDGRRHRFEPRLVPALAASSNTDPLFKGAKGNQYNLGDVKPVFEVVESPGGLYIGARRNAEDGNYYWRITPMGDAVRSR